MGYQNNGSIIQTSLTTHLFSFSQTHCLRSFTLPLSIEGVIWQSSSRNSNPSLPANSARPIGSHLAALLVAPVLSPVLGNRTLRISSSSLMISSIRVSNSLSHLVNCPPWVSICISIDSRRLSNHSTHGSVGHLKGLSFLPTTVWESCESCEPCMMHFAVQRLW